MTALLAALDARIDREIQRLRARYELSLDEFRGLYISDEHVDRLVATSRHPSAPDVLAPIDRPAAAVHQSDGRWRELSERFDLTPLEEDLLLVGAAPEFDLKYETLYAYLNNDVTRKWPTVDLAQRLLADVDCAGAVVAALAAGSTLHTERLIVRIDGPAGRGETLSAGFSLHPCVVHWLHGHSAARAFDAGPVTWRGPGDVTFDDLAHARATPVARLVELWSPGAGPLPIVRLPGASGEGRSATAAAIAALSARPLVRIDVRGLLENDAPAALDRLHVALTLEPAVVLLDIEETASDEEARDSRHWARFARAVARWPPGTLVLLRTSDEGRWRTLGGPRRLIHLPCDGDAFSSRLESWRRAVDAQDIAVSDPDLRSLAGRFTLTPGQVRAALATARDLATMAGDERPRADQIAAAARHASDQSLGRLASKIERQHDWPDLVLPPTTLRRLRELAGAIRHRQVVFGEWGFSDRIVNGTGIKALFAGASGTGKTMAAGVIARELGLDLYKVDLSGVVSKYIGETEKNIDRIFRAARSSNAIVFLDEAEAIMGKRSEVKDAHDRYANIEVAYLLQRLEDHDGIVILATNLKRNIDDAFNRRMHYVIDFPRPEEAERERIWRRMFPGRAPVGGDVDFAFLARQFDLAGGDIRNVVLDAAFLAADNGGVIDMRTVIEALARQLAKEGKTPTGTDFRQYQRLLPAAAGRRDGR